MANSVRVEDARLRVLAVNQTSPRPPDAIDDARVFVATDSGEDQGDGTTIVACQVAAIDAEPEEGGDFTVTVFDESTTVEVVVVGEDLQLTQGDLLLARRVRGDWHAIHLPPCSALRDATVRVMRDGAGVAGQAVRVLHHGAVVKQGVTNAIGRIFFQVSYPTTHDVEVLNGSGEVIATGAFAWSCDSEGGETVVTL